MTKIYSPQEDSYLMSYVLKKEIPKILNKSLNLRFLEIGCGSGINLETAFEKGIKKENIFSCDINLSAVNHCKFLGFNSIKSDLFENISGKYDLIIFNPPYLPEDKRESKDSAKATTGGKKGSEIIERFLKQAKKNLSRNGKIFLLTSSFTPKINFGNLGYNSKLIETKNLFYEKLFVWELKLQFTPEFFPSRKHYAEERNKKPH